MNRHMIRYVLGNVLKIEAVFLLLSSLVALIYWEHEGIFYLAVAALCGWFGLWMTYRKPESYTFYLKEGCLTTALAWILLSAFGALPFFATGEIPSYIDALFETISGFTTTGASILPDVEALSHVSLFWRSFTHWIGGMGVLVFLLAVVPMGGGGSMNLMRAESPGPSVGKLVPKIRATAGILYKIYLVMTVLECVLLLISGMHPFHAITLSFGTAGTGGFGVLSDSIASYTYLQKWIITVFMMLFGVNFNFYYLLLMKQFKKGFLMEEVRWYFIIIIAAIVSIWINIKDMYQSSFECLTDAAFQVGSIITTTGYATTDFDRWPSFSKNILVILMFIGACAGSTGGGMKVSRGIIGFRTLKKELQSYIHPKSVKKIKYEDKPIEHDVLRSLNVFIITYLFLFWISVFFVSLDENDMLTNYTAVAATLNNIGPGLSMVGPTENFAFFSVPAKLVLMIDMLAGRLELFPILILFHPDLWKDFFAKRSGKESDF
ncbi:MAG: TrkH family potassium uptake protein [Lachnospiraceae bacterium]|nr:TrkH family potassium uptake protein [Lachnospiraceae bacterium]